MITHDRLRTILSYDMFTGLFHWKIHRPGCLSGKVAGHKKTNGYLRIGIDYKSYALHRLAWFYMTGRWPKEDIDHINGIRDDNRFGNLRCVSRGVNLENQKRAQSDNVLGVLGVQKKGKRFSACITVKGEQKYLGMFATAKEAHNEYLRVKRHLHQGCTI